MYPAVACVVFGVPFFSFPFFARGVGVLPPTVRVVLFVASFCARGFGYFFGACMYGFNVGRMRMKREKTDKPHDAFTATSKASKTWIPRAQLSVHMDVNSFTTSSSQSVPPQRARQIISRKKKNSSKYFLPPIRAGRNCLGKSSLLSVSVCIRASDHLPHVSHSSQSSF
jgi:hypothetical protein